jgi:1,4-alpha-glucan branching enzyme
MPASLENVHPDTPMGANLIADGATFRAWAPNAHSVHVIGEFNGRPAQRTPASSPKTIKAIGRASSAVCATGTGICST